MIHSLKPGDTLYPVRYTEPSFTNIAVEFDDPETLLSVEEVNTRGFILHTMDIEGRKCCADILAEHVHPDHLYDAGADTAYYPTGENYKNLLRNQIAEAEGLKYAAIKRHAELSALYYEYFSK